MVQRWLVSVTHISDLTMAMAVVSCTVLNYGGGAGPNMSPAHTRARGDRLAEIIVLHPAPPP